MIVENMRRTWIGALLLAVCVLTVVFANLLQNSARSRLRVEYAHQVPADLVTTDLSVFSAPRNPLYIIPSLSIIGPSGAPHTAVSSRSSALQGVGRIGT